MFGDVHDPETVRLSGVEGPLDQIVGRLGIEVTPGAAASTAPVDAGHPAWRIRRSTRLREQRTS